MRVCFLTAALALSLIAAPAPAQAPPSYAKQVRPFLAKYCLECHNARAAKGGLSLETYGALKEGGDGGPVLEAGQPDRSRLVLLAEGKEKPAMPPKKAAAHPTKEEVAVLRAWVAAGAKDDSAAVKVVLPAVKPRQALPAPVAALAYGPDGKTLFVGRGSELRLLDSASGHELASPAVDPDRQVTAIAAATPDRIALGVGRPGDEGRVLVGPLGTKRAAAGKPPHKDLILDVALQPQGALVASAGYDTLIKLSDAATGAERLTLKEHSDAVYGVAFSPDGKLLASCSADRALKVWDVAAGKLLYTLGEATDWLYAVAWSPDGKWLAAGGADKSVRVYEPGPAGARLARSVFAHQGPVQKLAFAPDSRTLYSVGQDRVLKAWDVARMVERKVYEPQPETVLALAVRPDGKQLALGRYDGVVRLLDPATGQTQHEWGATPKTPPTPAVKKMTPGAGKRGVPVRVTLEGDHLDAVKDLTLDAAGAKARIISQAPGALQAELLFPATTHAGVYKVLPKAMKDLPALTFTLDAFDLVPEADAGSSPATGQRLTLPASVAGALDRAGGVDFYRFEAKKGQPLGVHLVTAPGVTLEPSLQLTDLAGRVLASATKNHLGHTFAADGTYALAVRDHDFRGGPNMTYRLHLGDLPVVTAVFPLGVRRGTEADVRLDGVFLGRTTARVSVPAAAEPGTKILVPVPGALGTAQVVAGEFPAVQAGTISVPGSADGRLREAGQADVWPFTARKGERLVVEVHAARLGSDLDSVIEITDRDGRPVPRAVLRCQAKTYVTFRDHDSAANGIRIEAWGELAANDYLYVGTELMRVRELPTHPDADCSFFSAAGRRLGYLDTTPTHHSLNVPMYKVSVHPPGTTFPPNGFPVFTLFYRNDDGGPGYGRDARVLFEAPADGEYRVRLRDARGQGGENFGYRLTVRPPRPGFNVSFSPTQPTVFKGGAVPVSIQAERVDGYDGPIRLRFAGLPPGLSCPPTLIDAETFSSAVPLYADADAPATDKALTLVAEAEIDGKTVAKEVRGQAPKLAEPGDLVTTTLEPEVTLRPGGQATLTVVIERRKGFAGRVPLDVRGLPHGVRVLDIGLNGILVNEGETRRTIVLYADPWVAPTERPLVVLSRREGTNAEHAARAVLLKVRP